MALLGALGGALSEVFIAFVYRAGFQLGLVPGSTIAEIYRCVVWGISGGMIGGLTAHSVPNLRLWRAISAGLVGGAIGCLGFLLLGAVSGRLLGFGIQGLAIGLSIVVAEKLAREASLEIIWAPNEITVANLGERPVFIGGGREDDVFVRGYPARHAGITLKQGRVEYLEGATGRQATLKHGSRMEIGKLTVVVHTDAKS